MMPENNSALKIEYVAIGDLRPWEQNPRRNDESVDAIVKSIQAFGYTNPILVRRADKQVIAGHTRIKAMQQIGETHIPVIYLDLDETDAHVYAIFDNKSVELADWDLPKLADLFVDLDGLNVDLDLTGFGMDEIEEIAPATFGPPVRDDDDVIPEPPADPISKTGDLWLLGEHRLLCGDCTISANVERLMGGEKADMVFTDPPYGIGKDIQNDRLKGDDWESFYRAFTDNILSQLIENAYVYVWGYFDTLSRYWEKVIIPRGDCNYRNFIIWKKTYVQGLTVGDFRQFPEHYEACLLYIFGQPFQNGPWSTTPNAEHYWEGFEPIRKYLDTERKKMGWDIPTVKKLVGHSDLVRDHWFNKSQWSMPTREVYEKLQQAAKHDAFRKDYDELRKDYDELRGYFDNTQGWTDIWEIGTPELYGSHPTRKPVQVAERAVKTTSRPRNILLDTFLGSGTTLIACEKLNRRCYGMEIEPRYVDVTVKRWEDYTGKKAKLSDA
jgi:DNA modification methylase